MKWTYVCKAEQQDQDWQISLQARPYVNDLLLFLGFSLVFYGGGLLGGFEYFLGELDFTQKSNRRIFLGLVLAWYIPIFISQVYKRLGTKKLNLEFRQGQWILNGQALAQVHFELKPTQDAVHGNDVDQIWLQTQEGRVMVYQSVNLPYVKDLYQKLKNTLNQTAENL